MSNEIGFSSNLLRGTVTVVIGVANTKSIAYSIAKLISDHGGQLIITYMDEVYKEKIIDTVKGMNVLGIFYYNASEQGSAEALTGQIRNVCPYIDNFVHAIARADKNQLRGRYCDTTLENFLSSMQVSCFSFTELACHLSTIMRSGGSMITLSYYGSMKYVANYNVMGVCKAALEASVRYLAVDMGVHNIRVNAISPGPIKTLAASGIKDFNHLIDVSIKNSPMGVSVSIDDVAGVALFLACKEMSARVTGQVLYVDAGCSIVWATAPKEDS